MPTVLVADDDAFTRDVFEKLLRRHRRLARARLEIVTAEDGEQALERFRQGGVDLIVLDLLMPKLDGFAVVEAIRGDDSGRDIPIAVTSGVYKDNRISSDLEKQHGAKFFAKPYQIKQLVEFVADTLVGPEEAAAPAQAAAPARRPAIQRRGDLAVRPLAAVLLDLYDDQATGALEIEHVRDRKEIELYLGHPVSIASNVREETLGHYLMQTGVIDAAQHRAGMSHAVGHAKKIGEALIELGHLTPEGLLEALTGQTRHKLSRALRWPSGSWRFRSRDNVERGARGDRLDLLDVVVAGLRDSVVLDPMPASLASLGDATLRLTERGRRLLPVLHTLVDPRFPSSFGDGATLVSLRATGLGERELLTCLDVLLTCGGLEAEAPAAPAPPEPALYSLLFDDDESGLGGGAVPLSLDGDLDADTGPIAVTPAEIPVDDDAILARRELVEEYLRVQGLSHYEILGIDADAGATAIRAACAKLDGAMTADRFRELDLGRDHAKLEELRVIYAGAAKVLLDAAERKRYDAGRASATVPVVSPLALEVAFRDAEALLEGGNHEAAVRALEEVVARAPDEAAYVATLGWAQFLAAGDDSPRRSEAKETLRRAVELDPKSSAARAALGRVAARLGNTDEAVANLDQALELDPTRLDAFAALRDLRVARGEGRVLERRLRRMIAHLDPRQTASQRAVFLELATLYGDVLGDRAGALLALDQAARLAPGDAEVAALRARLSIAAAAEDGNAERSRRAWRAHPGDPGPIRALFADAQKGERHDRAFLAAAVLESVAPGPGEISALYQRHRPRFLVRAQQRLVGDPWLRALHDDDAADLGELFTHLSPVIAEALPASSARAEVARGTPVDHRELSPAFADVLRYVCHVMDVALPPIVVRRDFGAQVHVGALHPAVLLAGEDALGSSDRISLGFILGRAVSYLRGGRAIAASRPARMLKRAVMAAFSLSQPEAMPERDRDLAALADHLRTMTPPSRREIAALVQRVALEHRELDLSQWTRSLARSADRIGLLLCGDPCRALALAESVGGEEARSALLEFALSSQHEALRRELGTSIDV